MNVICQNKNCNKKWTNIILLELKSTTFSLFLCENHTINLEHELLPKWLKTCEKLRKNNKIKKEKFIMKTWIKTNLSKITLALALIGAVSGVTGLIIGSISHHKTNDLSYFLDHDYNAHWGGASIWQSPRSDHYKIDLYFAIKPANKNDKKWDGNYPYGYFDN